MSDAIIAYNFASRSRPTKFFNCLDNIREMSNSTAYFIVAKIDSDDTGDYSRLKNYPEVILKLGASENKIHAINRDLTDIPDWHIMCNHSDDMVFIKNGFDVDIRKAFEGFRGLVHFPDQVAKDALITYAMMHRDYYELDGYIYHPEFANVYCDNYQQYVAKQRKLYKYIDKNILEHRHPIWGFGIADELLKKTEEPIGYKRDNETLLRLKKMYEKSHI